MSATSMPPTLDAEPSLSGAIVWLSRWRMLSIVVAGAYVLLMHTVWGIRDDDFLGHSSQLCTGMQITEYGPCYPLGLLVCLELLLYVLWPRRRIQRVANFSMLLLGLLVLAMTYNTARFTGFEMFAPKFSSPTPWFWISATVSGLLPLIGIMENVLLWSCSAETLRLISPPAPHKSNDSSAQLVLLIHGTGSANPNDRGSAWWQVGSQMWQTLHDLLPGTISGPAEADVFHWSGLNLESARRDAGLRLLKTMKRLEQQGRPYHLIGHSHGGSVIWSALRGAVRRRMKLERLQTFTTMGTPFLSYGPDIQSAPLIIPLLIAVVIAAAATRFRIDFGDVGITGLKTASHWWLPIGLAAAVLLVVIVSGIIRLYAMCLAGLRGRVEAALDQGVDRWFGDRWLCIWSTSDEAINGLRGTLNIDWQMFYQSERRVATTALNRLKHLLLLPVNNPLVTSALDAALWQRLQRKLQGNDLIGARLLHAGPVPRNIASRPVLPAEIDTEVVGWADRHAALSMQAIRASLGLLAASAMDLTQISHGVSHRLNGRELVHFSYYQTDSIKRRIANHLLSPSTTRPSEQITVAQATSPSTLEPWRIWRLSAVWSLLTAAAGLTMLAGYRQVVEPYTERAQLMNLLWDEPQPSFDDQATLEWADQFIEAGLVDNELAIDRASLPVKLALVHRLMQQHRVDDAAAIACKIRQPFYACIAFVRVQAECPGRLSAADFAPTEDKSGFMGSPIVLAKASDFQTVASHLASSTALDGLVKAALRLPGIQLVRDGFFSEMFGKSDGEQLRDIALNLSTAFTGNPSAEASIAAGASIDFTPVTKLSPADVLTLDFARQIVPRSKADLDRLAAAGQWADAEQVHQLARLAVEEFGPLTAESLQDKLHERNAYYSELLQQVLIHHHTPATPVPPGVEVSESPTDLITAAKNFDSAIEQVASASVDDADVSFQLDMLIEGHIQSEFDARLINRMVVRKVAELGRNTKVIRKYLDAQTEDVDDSDESAVQLALGYAALGDAYTAWNKAKSLSLVSQRWQVRTAILRHYLAERRVHSDRHLPSVGELLQRKNDLTGRHQYSGGLFSIGWN